VSQEPMLDISRLWAPWHFFAQGQVSRDGEHSMATTLLDGMIDSKTEGRKGFRSWFPIRSKDLGEPHPLAVGCWSLVLWRATEKRPFWPYTREQPCWPGLAIRRL